MATRAAPASRARRHAAAAKVRLGTRAQVRERATLAVARLKDIYPDAVCELDFETPLQLLVATILSAQTTDVRVNQVTPELFRRYPSALAIADANPADVEKIIQPTGFFRQKTKSIIGCCRALVERYDGQVPPRMDDLVTLPGVGRKTANVVLGVAFRLPGFAVDTHVNRLTRRLGLTRATDPVKIETEVTRLVPPPDWSDLSLRLILHGRRVCYARKPNCPGCGLNDFCPSSTVG